MFVPRIICRKRFNNIRVREAFGRVAKASFCLLLSLCLLLSQLSFSSLTPCEPAVAQTISIVNPHKGYQYNYKGNLHAHSANVDGTDPPATVGQWYKDNGYDFYAITDHDYLTPNPNVDGILWMGGAEEDSHDGSSGHMNHINVTSPINSGTDQERINNAQNQGGGSILNHPVAPGKGWSPTTIAALNGALGMEVYNGGGANSSSIWDSVLSSEKIIWGTASDDSHSSGGGGTAYIVVNSNNSSPTKEEILTQTRAGNFYASRGFNLSVSVAGETITTQTTNGNQIKWIKQSGQVIKTTNAQTDTYTVNGSEKYVRVEILDASGEPRAWSQPLTVHYTHPNGCLVKAASSPKVYLLEAGKKRWVTSPFAFLSQGFSFQDVVTISSSGLATYQEGEVAKARAGTLVKGVSTPYVYIIDHQGTTYYKRWITSPQVFVGLGLRWENIWVVSDQEVEEYTLSSPVDSLATHPNGCLIRSLCSPKVYFLEEGKKRWVTSPFAFSSYGFDWKNLSVVSQQELASFIEGTSLKGRIGSLMRANYDNKVYVVDLTGGTYYKRWITSPQIFVGLGLRWENICVLSNQEVESYTTGDAVNETP